ncbi:MAG: hypothetical protein QGH94_08635 [Phycisphaerae bacterium]|jgi:hypothetical protein|nr:hypothetical protein [Phycisphaerae bacterium]MDP7288045.1 hypothetical protein [Phycisphaerae bacterium]
MRKRIRLTLVLGPLLLLSLTARASAFSYAATPLAKSIAEHDLIVIGEVMYGSGGKSVVRIVRVLKGEPKTNALLLSSVWRPGTQWSFGEVPLKKSGKYLLMLKKEKGVYKLSADYASRAVSPINPKSDRFTNVVLTLIDLAKSKKYADRKQILAKAYDKLDQGGRHMLLGEFANAKKPDAATVPFLIRCVQ